MARASDAFHLTELGSSSRSPRARQCEERLRLDIAATDRSCDVQSLLRTLLGHIVVALPERETRNGDESLRTFGGRLLAG